VNGKVVHTTVVTAGILVIEKYEILNPFKMIEIQGAVKC